jgi:hypothetical protein
MAEISGREDSRPAASASAIAAAANPEDDDPKPMLVGKEFSDAVLDARKRADVVGDTANPVGRASRDAVTVDDEAVAVQRRVERRCRRRLAGRGTEADRIVVRQAQFVVAHPVILHESLYRVGSRGCFHTGIDRVSALGSLGRRSVRRTTRHPSNQSSCDDLQAPETGGETTSSGVR